SSGAHSNVAPTGSGHRALSANELRDARHPADGDYCSGDCTAFPDSCGDANDSGTVTAIDAAQILRAAVELPPGCELWRCDVNTSGTITAVDGNLVLRKAVGLAIPAGCENLVKIRVGTEHPIMSIGLEVEHGNGPGQLVEAIGELPRCDLPVNSFAAAGETVGALKIGLVSLSPLHPQTIVCHFRRFAEIASE